MNAYLFLTIVIGLLFAVLVQTTSQGLRVWKWMFHGPIKREVSYLTGTGREYADGHLEYITNTGLIIDLSRELYDTPRTWHLCLSKYGENGTTATIKNRTYWEMIDEVNAGDGQLTFVDIFTGLVHIRISAV